MRPINEDIAGNLRSVAVSEADCGFRLARPLQYDVERALAAVTAVGASHGGNVTAVRTGGKPVQQLRAYGAAPNAAIGRFCRARFSRYHQQDARARGLRLHKPGLEPRMRLVQRVTVQVERQIGLDTASSKPTVPVRIEIRAQDAALITRRCFASCSCDPNGCGLEPAFDGCRSTYAFPPFRGGVRVCGPAPAFQRDNASGELGPGRGFPCGEPSRRLHRAVSRTIDSFGSNTSARPRALMPPAIARASPPAPQKVSNLLAPLMAPPVS